MGKNRLAVECARVVVEAGDRIVLAVLDPGDDGDDSWQPSFRKAAEAADFPTFAPSDVSSPTAVARLAAVRPELIFSFQYAQILRPPVIALAQVATLNLHYGPLPRYRGVAPIAWALINGESATGVTLHHVDPGVDSGDVVCAVNVPIARGDTGRSLYDKCTDAGIRLFTDWYPRLRAGAIPRIPQNPSDVLYYNRHSIDFRDRAIPWHTDVERLANWIRAFIFPPYQYPTFRCGDLTLEVSDQAGEFSCEKYGVMGTPSNRPDSSGWESGHRCS
jgi:methionyl-tRNA formyltransferase